MIQLCNWPVNPLTVSLNDGVFGTVGQLPQGFFPTKVDAEELWRWKRRRPRRDLLQDVELWWKEYEMLEECKKEAVSIMNTSATPLQNNKWIQKHIVEKVMTGRIKELDLSKNKIGFQNFEMILSVFKWNK